MTTDELERDLKTLAEPQEADERLRLAIRAQLVGTAAGTPKAPSGPVARSERPLLSRSRSQWRS